MGSKWTRPAPTISFWIRVASASRRDPLEIELRGPPSSDAVFDLEPRRGIDAVSFLRHSRRGGERDLEVAAFFEVVIVGHEIRALLRQRRQDGQGDQERGEDAQPKRKHATPSVATRP